MMNQGKDQGKGKPTSGATKPKKDATPPAAKEPLVAAKTAPVTGDRGNPHYAAELEKNAREAKLDSQIVSGAVPAVVGKVAAKTAPITGDRGNPHYAAELEKAEKVAVSKSTAPGSLGAGAPMPIEEPMMMKKDTSKTGDKGNPHYAAELDKAKKETKSKSDMEAKLESQMMSSSSCKAPLVKEELAPVEKMMKQESSARTGDRGNPHYAAELDKAKKDVKSKSDMESQLESQMMSHSCKAPLVKEELAPVEKMIKQETSARTGDRGNPHYAAELEKAKKESDTESKLESQIMSSSSGAPMLFEEPMMKKESSAKTGDRGNPHYAAELEKEAKKSAPEKVEKAQQSAATAGGKPGDKDKGKGEPKTLPTTGGGRGNPSYLDELMGGNDGKKEDKAAKKDVKDTKKDAKDTKKDANDTKKDAKDTKKDEKDTKKDAKKEQVETKKEVKTSTTAAPQKVEQAQAALSTGGRGNPSYLEELTGGKEEKREVKQEQKATAKVQKVETAKAAPSTGGRGNPSYLDELMSGDKEEKKKDSAKGATKKDDSKDSKDKSPKKTETPSSEKKAKHSDGSADPLFTGSGGDAKKTPAKKDAKSKAASLVDDDKPLFGEDKDDGADLFSFTPTSSSKSEQKKKTDSAKKSPATPKDASDSDDDLRPQPPPPPLFPDDDDDDDLDWLK